MTHEELRALAASEHGYVASRLVTYREDGTAPPDAIRRLGTLANAVLAFLPGLAEISASVSTAAIEAERDGFRDAYMSTVRAHEITTKQRDEAQESLAIARKALYEIGSVLDAVNAKFDGSEPVAAQETTTISEPVPRKPSTPAPSVGTVSGTAWPASGLYHGLVLVSNGAWPHASGDRRLFGEPAKGQFTVQTVAPDGLTAGEPWSTMSTEWPASEWHEWTGIPIAAKPAVPKYDAPIEPKKKAPAADRTLPMFAEQTPATSAPAQKTIGDYAPDDAQFAKWAEALNKALATEGKEPVTIENVRDVFADWKAEHANEEKSNPAATFWHAAKAAIVG